MRTYNGRSLLMSEKVTAYNQVYMHAELYLHIRAKWEGGEVELGEV